MQLTNEITGIIREMENIFDGNPWYGVSIQKILQGISSKSAFSRPIPQRHCIAELLAHVISWRELLNKRLHGNDFFDVDQKESFQWQRFGNDQEATWENLLTSLKENQKQIINSLKITDDTLLEQKVAHRDYTYRYLIRSIIRHDIYHFGQIAYLK